MTTKPSNRGSRHSPEQSRNLILEAAAKEFASQGLAGARTDAIAKAAGVNKALLYYYFGDKEALYGAVLQHVLGDLLQQVLSILDTDRSASYRILRYLATHFNFVASHPEYRRLIQFEMMRAGAGDSPHFKKLIEKFFRPLMMRIISVLQEGIDSGEFRKVNPQQFLQSMISSIVFYFVAMPALREMMPVDPLSRPALQQRRDAVLDFVSGALFSDRESAVLLIRDVNRDVEPLFPHPGQASKGGKKL